MTSSRNPLVGTEMVSAGLRNHVGQTMTDLNISKGILEGSVEIAALLSHFSKHMERTNQADDGNNSAIIRGLRERNG